MHDFRPYADPVQSGNAKKIASTYIHMCTVVQLRGLPILHMPHLSTFVFGSYFLPALSFFFFGIFIFLTFYKPQVRANPLVNFFLSLVSYAPREYGKVS
jgi:hypothetical protein